MNVGPTGASRRAEGTAGPADGVAGPTGASKLADGTDGPTVTARRPDWPALAVSVALLGLAGVIAYDGYRVSARRVIYGLAPGTVPYVVGACMAALAVGLIITALRGGFPRRERDAVVPVLWIIGGLVAQIALLKTAGFSIATGLVFAATARAMGRGPLAVTVPFGVVFAFAIWLAFTQLLNLSLPAGPPERAIMAAADRILSGAPAEVPAGVAPAIPASQTSAPPTAAGPTAPTNAAPSAPSPETPGNAGPTTPEPAAAEN